MIHPHKCRSILIPVLAVFLIAAAARVQETAAQDAPAAKFVSDYKIGPKDLLDIKVLNGDRFNTQARVSEEGKIGIPYLGDIVVQGLTSGDLEKKLVQIISEKYLNNPQVVVTIKEFQSGRVSVLGAVKEPGAVQLMGRQTLLQVISAVGGTTRDAGREIILIRRQPDGTSSALHIPADDLLNKGETKYDVPLEPGDIINVQVDRTVQIYVMGQVKNPGALNVLESRIPTITMAIAQAGGFTERAREGKVLVNRRDAAGNEKRFEIDVSAILKGQAKDFPLEANDFINVPQTLW